MDTLAGPLAARNRAPRAKCLPNRARVACALRAARNCASSSAERNRGERAMSIRDLFTVAIGLTLISPHVTAFVSDDFRSSRSRLAVAAFAPSLMRAARHFFMIHGVRSPSFLSRCSPKLAVDRATVAAAVRMLASAHGAYTSSMKVRSVCALADAAPAAGLRRTARRREYLGRDPGPRRAR
jgi:hypothetical protein